MHFLENSNLRNVKIKENYNETTVDSDLVPDEQKYTNNPLNGGIHEIEKIQFMKDSEIEIVKMVNDGPEMIKGCDTTLCCADTEEPVESSKTH